MTMSYDLKFGKGQDSPRRPAGDTTRVLVLGDFSGDAAPPEPRRPIRVDITRFDALVAKVAPMLALEGAGARLLKFRSLDDFHPDVLVRKVPALTELIDLRQRLNHPSTSAEAVAKVRGAVPAPAQPNPSLTASPSGGGSLFSNLIGGSPADRPAEAPAAVSPLAAAGIDSLIHSIVAPHVKAGKDPAADDVVRVTDAVIATGLKEVLHAPRFQALEAAYRGLAFLTSRSEAESVEYYVLSAKREELISALGDGGAVTEALSEAGPGFSLVIGVLDFGDSAEDLALLRALSAATQDAGALFLAGAAPVLVGAPHLSALAKARSADAPNAAWKAFRDTDGAPHAGLVLPRFLVRAPYGKKTDPIESCLFEEVGAHVSPSALLWANGAFAAAFALLVAQASGETPGGLDIDDLPNVVTEEDGERQLVPCAEVSLGERSIDAVIAAGLMPLSANANQNSVKFVRSQSIASPPTALSLPELEN
jgi:type VI secretion system ImpC/EvpB family protein/type VI secretion system ImpB/VipA family protein